MVHNVTLLIRCRLLDRFALLYWLLKTLLIGLLLLFSEVICSMNPPAPAVEAGGFDADPPARSSCFPSINNQALNALSTANAAPSSETRRKALTNDSSIVRLSAACASPLTLVGMDRWYLIAAGSVSCTG